MQYQQHQTALRLPQETPRRSPATITSRAATRAARLEQRAPSLVAQAHDAGVDITYLGVAPLFEEARAYGGPNTDWVIAPVDDASREIVPRTERQTLERLIEAGIDFPLVYVAHELPKGRLDVDGADGRTPVRSDRAAVTMAVRETPDPVSAVDLSERLGRSSAQLLNILGKALPIAGAVVAAPFVVAGVALGALARLDPIVFGVIPAGGGAPGEPAAWYVLAQWDW